jgi:hypothetical protein
MRWRRREIGLVIVASCQLDCTNAQSLQTGGSLPMTKIQLR